MNRDLERAHQPRTLKTRSGSEPRLSVADEQAITDSVRIHERRETRADALARIATMRAELDALAKTLQVAAPGDHRNALRMVRRGLDSLERSINE